MSGMARVVGCLWAWAAFSPVEDGAERRVELAERSGEEEGSMLNVFWEGKKERARRHGKSHFGR